MHLLLAGNDVADISVAGWMLALSQISLNQISLFTVITLVISSVTAVLYCPYLLG